MFVKLDQITEIQIDHSSRCNLGCPQCARTVEGWSLLPENKNLDLSVDDYKILLEPFPEKKIKLFHCGNYGEALASPTFDETFDFSLLKKPRQISVSTNGSLRSPSFWKELARRGGDSLTVIFAIDGLEDTNHMYRIGSSWDKIMKNVEAFIEAGGNARWDFIEFEHNFHQIEIAERLAKGMGFKKFNLKYTSRFSANNTNSERLKSGGKLLDRKNNLNQKDAEIIRAEYKSFDEYVNKTKITCKYKAGNKVFVDMHLKLWPCTWFGAPPYLHFPNKQKPSFDHLETLYGKDYNCLRTHGWGVLESPFFEHHLERSWEAPNEKYKRIYTCGRTCGEKFSYSSGYGQNRNITIL